MKRNERKAEPQTQPNHPASAIGLDGVGAETDLVCSARLPLPSRHLALHPSSVSSPPFLTSARRILLQLNRPSQSTRGEEISKKTRKKRSNSSGERQVKLLVLIPILDWSSSDVIPTRRHRLPSLTTTCPLPWQRAGKKKGGHSFLHVASKSNTCKKKIKSKK
jgi:hypothetical protein